MKIQLIIFFSILSFNILKAQNDAATVIKQINEAYDRNKNMLITNTYKMYVNHTTNTAYETLEGITKKQGLKLTYQLKNIERLENASRRIVINNDDKTMFVEPNTKDRSSYIMDANLEKYLQENKIGTIEDKGTQLVLTIALEAKDIEKIQIVVNKSSFMIDKFITYYKQAVRLNPENLQMPEEKPRMEVSFQINLNPTFNPNDFKESKFIKVVNGKVSLSEQYKNYRLMSLDN